VSLLAIIGMFTLFTFAPDLGEYFEGAGLEITKTILLFSCVSSLLIGSVLTLNKTSSSSPLLKKSVKNPVKISVASYLIMLGLSILLTLNGTNFIIYLHGYLQKNQDNFPLFLGVKIAAGICLSFCILYYFLLRWIIEQGKEPLVRLLWCLFIAGLLNQIPVLLAQVDLLSDAAILWDFSRYINDSSEYGHILNALIGYEATPSYTYALLYLSCIAIFYSSLILIKKLTKKPTTINEQNNLKREYS
jgi:high-affinity iron transporter